MVERMRTRPAWHNSYRGEEDADMNACWSFVSILVLVLLCVLGRWNQTLMTDSEPLTVTAP